MNLRSEMKYKDVSGRLANLIRKGKYPPSALLPSEKALSEMFGVSRVTVRSALNSLRDEKIIVSHPGRGWQVADDSGGEKRMVLVSGIPDSARIFDAMSRVCKANGWGCEHLPCPADNAFIEDPERMLPLPENADGIAVFMDRHPTEAFLAHLRRTGKPMLLLGYEGYTEFDTLCCDSFRSGTMLVDYLWARGHRRIAFFEIETIPNLVPAFAARRMGYETAMRQHGAEPSVLTMNGHFHSRRDSEDILAAWLASEKQRLGALPDAMILWACEASGPMARLLRSVGLRMPADISLCSIGDAHDVVSGDSADFSELTVYEEPWEEIGRQAAEILMATSITRSRGPSQTCIPSQIWEGDSVIDREVPGRKQKNGKKD